MGNRLCFCCWRCRGGGWCGHGGARIHDDPPPTTLIIHGDGHIESLYCPVPAGELMAANPGHVLCRAADLHAFTSHHDEFAAPPPLHLLPHQELQLGDSYVLLPSFIFSISPEHSSETSVLSLSQLIHPPPPPPPPPPLGGSTNHNHVHKHIMSTEQKKKKQSSMLMMSTSGNDQQINHHVHYMHDQTTTNINHQQQHCYPCSNDDDDNEEDGHHDHTVGNIQSFKSRRRAQAHCDWTPVLPTIQEITPDHQHQSSTTTLLSLQK